MERLIITDFGPIKSASTDLKKINVFIGYTSSGKSTIAKLFSILNSLAFLALPDEPSSFVSFYKLLEAYNINFEFSETTEIFYQHDKYQWRIKKDFFETTNSRHELVRLVSSEDNLMRIINSNDTHMTQLLQRIWDREKNSFLKKHKATSENISELLDDVDKRPGFLLELLKSSLTNLIIERNIPIYIPAERIIMTTLSNAIFSMLINNINIPDCLKAFGSLYEKARQKEPSLSIDFFNIKVSFSKEGDKILLQDQENTPINLSQASSGFQSVIPLMAVVNLCLKENDSPLIVVEEPELNLFPHAQTEIISYLIRQVNNSNGKLIITTHSPYVLSVLDNLILAYDVARNEKQKEKVKEIVPESSWVNFDSVSSYFFPEDGHIKDITDKEYRSVGAEYIDGASDRLSNTFDKLTDLKDYAL